MKPRLSIDTIICIKESVLLRNIQKNDYFKIIAIEDWPNINLYKVKSCNNSGQISPLSRARLIWASTIDSLIESKKINII